VKPKTLQQNF